MKKHCIYKISMVAALLTIVGSLVVGCGENVGTTTTFKGTVTSKQTGEPIENAVVTALPLGMNTETDAQGAYSMSLPRTDREIKLSASCMGYSQEESAYMPLSPKKQKEYVVDFQLESKMAIAQVDPARVDFGTAQIQSEITLSSIGTEELKWTIMELYIPEWLTITPTSGFLDKGESTTIKLTCRRTGLDLGKTEAVIQILGGVQPVDVPVTVEREEAYLEVERTTFAFGERLNADTTFLTNNGNKALDWAFANPFPTWLKPQSTKGSVPAGTTITVVFTVDRSELGYGEQTFTNELTWAQGAFPYSFSVIKSENLLSVKPSQLSFGSVETKREFTLWRSGGIDPIPFAITSNDSKLTVTPSQGTLDSSNEPITIVVTLDRSTMDVGSHKAIVLVTTASQEVPVEITYSANAAVPTVVTEAISLANDYTLLLNGRITDTGGGAVTDHGHVWSTEETPTLHNGTATHLGEGIAQERFSSPFTAERASAQTLYYRAYAQNEAGVAYGETVTLPYLPASLTQPNLSFVSEQLACSSRVSGFGSQPLLAHGFCVGTDPNPSLQNSRVVDLGALTKEGTLSTRLGDIQRGYTYYVRSFALNESGLVYSPQATIDLPVVAPEFSNGDAKNVEYYSALLEGEIISMGSEKVLRYGHCWSFSNPTPTPQDCPTVFKEYNNEYVATFTTPVNKLRINTKYYYRAYIETSFTTYYSEVRTFTTQKDNSIPVQDGMLMYLIGSNRTTGDKVIPIDWTGITWDLEVSNGVTCNTNYKPSGTQGALSFNGTSGYIMSRHFNPLSGMTKGTISFWIRMRSAMSKQVAYPFFGSVSDYGMFVDLRHNGTDWLITLNLGRNQQQYSLTLPSMGGMDVSSFLGTDWHMISIVSDGSSASFFLDGIEMLTQSLKFQFGEQDDFIFGANAFNSSVLNTFLGADMAAIRFYDRKLTPQDIAEIYRAGN